MTNHTPGPWKVATWTYDEGKESKVMIEGKSDAVAELTGLYRPGPRHKYKEMVAMELKEREANARLIAAAPDLLEACESAQLILDQLPEIKQAGAPSVQKIWEKLSEAIAQATEVMK